MWANRVIYHLYIVVKSHANSFYSFQDERFYITLKTVFYCDVVTELFFKFFIVRVHNTSMYSVHVRITIFVLRSHCSIKLKIVRNNVDIMERIAKLHVCFEVKICISQDGKYNIRVLKFDMITYLRETPVEVCRIQNGCSPNTREVPFKCEVCPLLMRIMFVF